MANPQCENGYIKIANELLEALAIKNIYGRGSANGQVIWAVLRKTYGYQKKEDAISISQLIKATELSRRTIIYSLQDLEAKKVLVIKRQKKQTGNEINIIRFNKNYEEWVVQNSTPQIISNRNRAAKYSAKLRTVVQNFAPGAKLTQNLVQNYENNERSFAPTKDIITKDNTKEIILYSQTSHEIRLSELLLSKILERRPTFKKPDLQKWGKEIDKMRRLDKRDIVEIEKVINWCQSDNFWRNNILSVSKLREQFDKLALRMEGKQYGQTGGGKQPLACEKEIPTGKYANIAIETIDNTYDT